jgi:hypothetical protein
MNSNNKNTNSIKKFINKLNKETTNSCTCNIENTKNKPSSKAQNIKKCGNTIIKGPKNTKNRRIEKVDNKSIKLDNITMNLLIQTIIKKYIDKKIMNEKDVEHYNRLCKEDKIIKLISAKANYDPKIKTLQDYIIENRNIKNINIKFIEDCLKQAFRQLDKLYEDIQFHHCDPKCAQLFLFKSSNNSYKVKCMLADLDKVTFTININNNPYRIRLTKDRKKNTIKGIFISVIDKMDLLNKITKMRFKSLPQNSNLLEKIIFISSACILLDNKDKAIELRDLMLNYIFQEYEIKDNKLEFDKIIKLNDYYKVHAFNRNNNKSLSTPVKYVDYKYLLKNYQFKKLLENNSELKSKIYLDENDNKININIK